MRELLFISISGIPVPQRWINKKSHAVCFIAIKQMDIRPHHRIQLMIDIIKEIGKLLTNIYKWIFKT